MNIKISEHFTYRKLLRFTIPSMAMMIFTSIYGMVDGFFVSNYAGKIAFAAVNLIMPLLLILAALGLMFGTGGSAIVAKTLGEGDKERANRYFSLFVYTAFVIGVVFAVLGFVFIRPIAAFLGAEGEVLKDCVIYGRIVLVVLPLYIWQQLFQSFFVTAEKPQLGFLVIVCAGVMNIVMDALLVTLLPQGLKLAGAAIATAMSLLVGGLLPLFYFSRPNDSYLRLAKPWADSAVLLKACINGSSEFMGSAAMSIVGILYNRQLLYYAGEDGIDAFGVMMYVSMMFSAVFVGYTIGTEPLVGFNYGAKNYAELKNLLRCNLTVIGCFSVVMFCAAQVLAVPLAKIFVGYDAALMQMTTDGFRIYSVAFLFMGFAIYVSGFFTSLSNGVISAVISFMRSLVFECSAVIILPKLLGISGIWWSVTIAEFMAVVMSVIFLAAKQKQYQY